MDLSDSPGRPACPSRASGWSSLTTPWGLPCCARFPCVHAVATTPAQRLGPASLTSPQSCQPSPIWQSGRPVHRHFRGLLGVHSRYGLHTRAVTVYRDTLTVGFSHFVTSMTAPVASGWSGCRVGLTPTGKRRVARRHCGLRLGRLGLAHRRPFEREPIGVVYDAIEDGVGKGGLADDLMPSPHRELAGDQRRTAAIAILDDLH